MAGTLILGYPASSFSGWGVEGLNMLLHWPGDIVTAMPDGAAAVLSDADPRKPLLDRRVAQSKDFQRQLAASGPAVKADGPVFVPLGNDLKRQPVAGGVWLTGRPTVAFPYIEEPETAGANREQLAQYDRIVVASEWNQQIVKDLGYEAVVIHQAVDTVLFNPLIRDRGRGDGKFRVFSGGKCEWRKGQDIVLAAFAMFAGAHPEAALVAAWDSPWRIFASSFEGRCALGAPPGANIGCPNFAAWAQKAGIAPHQFETVPLTPNCRMPDVLSTIDSAIFPSRAEGGTPQGALECAACGIPTLVHVASDSPPTVEGLLSFLERECDRVGREIPDLPEHFTWPYRIAALQRMLNEIA